MKEALIDADDEAVVGVLDATIWSRPEAKAPSRRKHVFEEHESARQRAA